VEAEMKLTTSAQMTIRTSGVLLLERLGVAIKAMAPGAAPMKAA
jgi:hypothetical protein